MKALTRILFPLAILLACCSERRQVPPEGAIQLPTMGWSSWNTYRVHISDSLIMSQADAMVATGLRDAGYDHIHALGLKAGIYSDAADWQDVNLTIHLEPGINVVCLRNDRGPLPDIDYADLRP